MKVQRTALNRVLAYVHMILSICTLASVVGCYAYSAYLVDRLCILLGNNSSCVLTWIGWGLSGVVFLVLSLVHTTAIASKWTCRIGMAYEKI